ncbi:MAG: DUF402 domain-containing protein [Ardenticatenaceae bacterium]|nr:DUF402 domain-containing protein [Ardenticatenaceae bacterium]
MSEWMVYKLDENGRVVWHYPAQILERQPNFVRLEAFFNRDDMALGYTTFKRGDRFMETFYTDRWYNVFAVYDRDDGGLKGWYCNVCRPARVVETAVYCEDLALDVWVGVDGSHLVLDEEEFAELALGEEERREGETAVQQILEAASERGLPA